MRDRRHSTEIKFRKVIAAQYEDFARRQPRTGACNDIVVAGGFNGSGRLSKLLMFGAPAVSIAGHYRRCPECGVDLCLNAAGGQGLQLRLGFAGSGGLANLELPSPNVRLGGGHDAILDAFVDHRKSPFPTKAVGLLFSFAINPDNYGIGPLLTESSADLI
jgi:hypothetical protein